MTNRPPRARPGTCSGKAGHTGGHSTPTPETGSSATSEMPKPSPTNERRRIEAEFADAIDEALRARAESRWMDPAYAESLSTAVRAALG